MLSSITTKVRTLLFTDEGTIVNEQSSRKRKRVDGCREDNADDDDDDVVVVSIKRPKIEQESLFSRIISSPYRKMAEWMKSKTKWNDSFLRPKTRKDNLNYSYSHQTPRNGRPNGRRSPNFGPETQLQMNYSVKSQACFQNRIPTKQDTISDTEIVKEQPESVQVAKFTSVPTQTDDVILINGDDKVEHDMKANNDSWNKSHSPFNKSTLKFTANNCVDYEEKEQYRQLLQQFTTIPIAPEPRRILSRPTSPSTTSERSNDSLVIGNLSTSRSVPHWRPSNRERYQPASRPITLINGSHSHKGHISEAHTARKAEVSRISVQTKVHSDAKETKSKSEDVLEKSTETSKSPCRFKQASYLTEEWVDEILTKYSAESRERTRKIEEAEIKSKVYEEKRKAREEHLEKEIQRRMRILSTEPAFAEEPIVEDLEEEKEEKFPELTDEMDSIISNALRPYPGDEVLVEGFRLQITRKDIATLAGLNWLNDEIINFYMNLLMERGKEEGKAKVYACNTFFYPKIISGGHASVRRWTRRVDVFSHDYILIPVHLGMHWCLAVTIIDKMFNPKQITQDRKFLLQVVDFKKKLVQYFDSMGGENMQCLNAIKKYLCDESLDKKKQEFDLTGWTTEIVRDIPQQMNGSDCGMFACKYAEYITRGAAITFTQEHMPYFRRRMVYEILKQTLLQ